MGIGESLSDFLFGMALMGVLAGLMFMGYQTQTEFQSTINAIEKVQDSVFSQITINTTNLEIIGIINKECNAIDDYKLCVTTLKNTFVINARGN